MTSQHFCIEHAMFRGGAWMTERRTWELGNQDVPIQIVRTIGEDTVEITVTSEGTEILTDLSDDDLASFVELWQSRWNSRLPVEYGCTDDPEFRDHELFVRQIEPFPQVGTDDLEAAAAAASEDIATTSGSGSDNGADDRNSE